MVTGFIRYLFKWIWFFVFQIKMKNEKQTSNLNFNVQYFENRKTIYFDVFCVNVSTETKIKTLFLIPFFNLSKKQEMALWVQGFFRTKLASVTYATGKV